MIRKAVALSLAGALLGVSSPLVTGGAVAETEYDGFVHVYGKHEDVLSPDVIAAVDRELRVLAGKQSPDQIAKLLAMENTVQLVDDQTLEVVAAVNVRFHSIFKQQ